MKVARKIAASFLPLLAITLTACGSDGSASSSTDVIAAVSPGGSSPDATDVVSTDSPADTTSTSGSATTTTTTLVPARNTLAGVWTAPAEDILSANLANLGGMPGMTCTGDIVMNLNSDGTFTRGGSMACTIDDVPFLGQVMNSSGTWDADADTLTVTVTQNDGYAESIGPDGKMTRVALPDGGYSSASYRVTATTLTITFTEPSVGTVTQVYTRD